MEPYPKCRHCEVKLGSWKDGYCSPQCMINDAVDPFSETLFVRRFEEKINKNGPIPKTDNGLEFDTPCHLWTGTTAGPKNYKVPQMRVGSKLRPAAHTAWVLHHQTAIGDKKVIHGCQNRMCVNPEHLILGTQREAVLNRRSKR